MKIESDLKLDFNDVLIKPKRSQAPSRSKVDLFRKFAFLNSRREWICIPIIASNMDTVATFTMARILASVNISTSLHKHYSLDRLVDFYTSEIKKGSDVLNYIFYTMGITDDDFEKINTLQKQLDKIGYTINKITVDVANAYTEYFQDKVKRVRERFPHAIIMGGNVATPEMVSELLISGSVDILKIGIGPGKSCLTRLKTACGYPQLSAILECADAAHGLNGHICADGGCTYPGDVAKAFGAGADFVMLGSMLAAHDECDEAEWVYQPKVLTPPGKPHIATCEQEKKSMLFYGMSSKQAMDKYHGGIASYRAAEGKCMEIPYRGSVVNTINDLLGSLRSTCTYVGTMKLKDLSKCTTFIRCNDTHNKAL
jgi:GMP reductase